MRAARLVLSLFMLLAAACARLPEPVPGISAARLEKTVRALVGFGSRHTASTGIVQARAWIKREFEAIDGLDVVVQSFTTQQSRRIAEGVEIANVYARLPGTKTPDRILVVSGHYDSRATDVMDAQVDAPGANDDASGVAVVLELARYFAAHRPESTILFLCVAGEEQGLLGSRHFARRAREANWNIVAMFTNDIVGNSVGPAGARHDDYVRVFSEGIPTRENPMGTRLRRTLGSEWDSASRQLARYVADAAGRLRGMRVKLVFRHDRFLRGGDHMAFNDVGYAAVRFTEPYENFARQHRDVSDTDGDLPDFVDYAYLARVARVNAVALEELANAPARPRATRIHARKLENTTTLSWAATTDDDLSHYEVVWRDTTAATWTHLRRVDDTKVTLPLSKDNWHFGVRAVDTDGNKSLVRYPRPLRR